MNLNKEIHKKTIFYLLSLLFFIPTGVSILIFGTSNRNDAGLFLLFGGAFLLAAGVFLLFSIAFFVLGIRQKPKVSLVSVSQADGTAIVRKKINPIITIIIGCVFLAFAGLGVFNFGMIISHSILYEFLFPFYLFSGLFGIIFFSIGLVRFFRN